MITTHYWTLFSCFARLFVLFRACSKNWVMTSIMCHCVLDMQNRLKIHNFIRGYWVSGLIKQFFYRDKIIFKLYSNIRKTFGFYFVSSESGDKREKKNQSETKYILLFNYQRGCKELCLISSNSYRYQFLKM